jgi:hypothetical protein
MKCRGRLSRSLNERAHLTRKRGNTIFFWVLRMKNVTIALDDAIATRADAEAARLGKSISEFVSDLIEREIERQGMTDLEAIQDFLSGPGIPATGPAERLPTRQEIYDERIDELVRRYERSNLLDR